MELIPASQLTGGRRCAVTNRTSDPEGFIDTRNILPAVDIVGGEGHLREISISFAAAKEMARMVGWTSPEEVEDLKARVAALGDNLKEANEQIDKLTAYKELETELVGS